MPEAVIVSTARTPIGRARKGSLQDVRPDDLLAFAIRSALDKVEGLDDGEIVDVIAGCALPEEKQGQNMAAARRAARRASGHGAGHDRQPLLRVQPADDPHGVPRDQGRRGRRVRLLRRRVGVAGERRASRSGRPPPEADGPRRRPDRRRLHPDGHDGRERRRALRRRARRHGPLRAALAGARRRGAGERLLRARDHPVHEGGRHGRQLRRRPASLVDAGGAAAARARVQARRRRHRRERVPAERRRRGARSC